MRIPLTILLFLAAMTFPGLAKTFIYTSLSGENTIAIHRLDPKTGKLISVGEAQADSKPGALTTDSENKYLYASLRGTSSVAVYTIDPESGELSHKKTTQLPGNAGYLFVDRTNRFLLSSYYGDGRVAVNRIDEDGNVLGNDLQVIDNGLKAHSIRADATNRFVFCPHTGEINKIDQYVFNPETGRLSPNNPPVVNQPAENIGPRHFQFHPDGEWVYFVNEQGGSVTGYTMDKKKGTLTAFETVSTIPKDFEEKNSCADIEVHPSGKFLYASNRGHDSIACFAIDPEGGSLIPLGQMPTETTPRSFDLDPDGKYLVAAGQKSGTQAVYRIDQETGKLTELQVIEIGAGPSWVEAVKF
ncbi:MAG: lactonase family protein [Verrucomicrobiota bacterium]